MGLVAYFVGQVTFKTQLPNGHKTCYKYAIYMGYVFSLWSVVSKLPHLTLAQDFSGLQGVMENCIV